MDLLETQVSDLRSFLGAPPPAPVTGPVVVGGTPVPGPGSVHTPSVAAYSPSPHPQPHPHSQHNAHPSHHPHPHNRSTSVVSVPAVPPFLRSASNVSTGDISALQQAQQQQQQQHQQQQHIDHDIEFNASPSPTASRASVSATVGTVANTNANSNKRKASEDEGGGAAKQQRSKRNRYISIACNECKRRKIKCNGQTPCQRCGHLNLQCLYAPNCCSNSLKDSEEFKQMADTVGRLQEQVETLFSNMNALRQETLRLAPIHERPSLPPPSATVTSSPSSSSMPPLSKPIRVPPSFNGPTSIAFTVDVAKNTLHNMGYTNDPNDAGDDHDHYSSGGAHQPSPPRSPILHASPTAHHPSHAAMADPIWEFDKNEMVRLCRLHEEEVGIMYPVIKVDSVIQHAKNLATWMDAVRAGEISLAFGEQDSNMSSLETLMLKIVMCCALTVEEHGNSARAIRLYESIQPIVDKTLMSEPADVAKVPFLALVAGYRFLSNDEILAWRTMGQVARLCLELGLHRREGLEKIPDGQDRRNALNTFWSAYVLDRRWSFGTGLPFVCDDSKIDPKLPLPEDYPYLVAMITYSRLGAKIWKLVDYFEPAVIRELKPHDFEELDRQILEWYDSVPEEVKVPSLDEDRIPMPSGPAYDLQRLQIWTRLRLNQIRIWLHTPVLHSAISIVDNMQLAQKAVDLAKETIRYLAQLNNTTNLYRRIQVFYHQFLTSAIAALFLASTHAPLQFSAECRAEFYMALELVKDMSARSWVSQRLWRTIKSLKKYAPRLGMEEEPSTGGRSNTGSPTVAMASMGVHHIQRGGSATSAPSPGPGPQNQSHSRNSAASTPAGGSSAANSVQQTVQQQIAEDQTNGLRLQTEMSRIYEGYMGMKGISPPNAVTHSPEMSRRLMSPSSAGGTGERGGMVAPTSSPRLGGGEVTGGGVGSGSGTPTGVYQQMKDMF